MNRPTIDVDELLDAADEALAANDFSQAVEILRKATTVAPLRRDIRNRLAVALERSPVSHKVSTKQSPKTFKDEPDILDSEFHQYDEIYYEPEPADAGTEAGGREAIGQIARKAFEAAAGQTARASEATKNLTNLLQQGIKTWKSSLAEAVPGHSAPTAMASQSTQVEPAISGASPQSNVFTPERELNEYLNRASNSGSTVQAPDAELDLESDDGVDESRVVRPARISNKATAASSRKKSQKPADVEDVLAAGIGGFIEAISTVNKTKVAYTCVYVGMCALFALACIDVTKKFPAVDAVPGQHLQTANLGSLNLNETSTADEAIAKSRSLVATGNTVDAINLLRAELESGRFLHNRDLVRMELAALLNGVAEQHLRANEFENSVSRYREAVEVLPTDAALQLRLGNALYYYGSLAAGNSEDKDALLSESVRVLEKVISKDSKNLQAHRLHALVYSARGDSKAAAASWKKVKALAAADSAEFKEAESYLK